MSILSWSFCFSFLCHLLTTECHLVQQWDHGLLKGLLQSYLLTLHSIFTICAIMSFWTKPFLLYEKKSLNTLLREKKRGSVLSSCCFVCFDLVCSSPLCHSGSMFWLARFFLEKLCETGCSTLQAAIRQAQLCHSGTLNSVLELSHSSSVFFFLVVVLFLFYFIFKEKIIIMINNIINNKDVCVIISLWGFWRHSLCQNVYCWWCEPEPLFWACVLVCSHHGQSMQVWPLVTSLHCSLTC